MTGERPAARRSWPALWLVRALLGAVALLPFAPWVLHGVPGLSLIADACERWFGFQCQRDPARTLHLFGRALPVCARCSGIYFGLGLGAWLAWPRVSARVLRWWMALASLFMLLDVLSEAFALRPAWAPLRVLSGLSLAYPVGVALLSAARSRFGEPSEAVLDAE